MTTFEQLLLIDPLLRAVRSEGYTDPTPIQVQAIPHVLSGRDLLGCAQTGTGKTAAFALPILQRLSQARGVGLRVLVLSPTRELASQIGASFAVYGQNLGLRHAVIYGGVGQDAQVRSLRSGVDILVATPGRLLDLMGQGHLDLARLSVLVLDEADRMLDMGFIHDVRRIVGRVPKERQTLLFSATMPTDIERLANDILRDPIRVAVTPPATTAERIEQWVYFVEQRDKRALLQHLLTDQRIYRVLVFTRTKHGANRVAQVLQKAEITAEAIHGNKTQGARERALSHFRSGETRVLVATDIAARGIDVEGITHVINFDLPNEAESYVHRIGRTARAGAEGIAFSFCGPDERSYLGEIQRLIRQAIPVVYDHPYISTSQGPLSSSGAASRPAERALSGAGKSEKPLNRRPPSSDHGGSRRAGNRPHRRATWRAR